MNPAAIMGAHIGEMSKINVIIYTDIAQLFIKEETIFVRCILLIYLNIYELTFILYLYIYIYILTYTCIYIYTHIYTCVLIIVEDLIQSAVMSCSHEV
jgi:hypothetical protein